MPLGESTVVRRLLPTMGRRMVGAWCFVDHYGPDEIAREPGMQVPPHPHTGLQTVSWLLDGEVHHRDSLGSDALIRPGELGLMTAGGGIAHSEQSPDPHSPVLHGAQLWVALPDAERERAPSFEHHRDLPVLREPGAAATVLLGELAGARSPGQVHTALIGVDVTLERGADAVLPLEGDFEHAVLTVSGAPEVDGGELEPGSLCYLGTGRSTLRLRADDAEPAAAPRRDPVHREDRDVVELHRAHGRGDHRGARPLAGGTGGGAGCDVRRERRTVPARSVRRRPRLRGPGAGSPAAAVDAVARAGPHPLRQAERLR